VYAYRQRAIPKWKIELVNQLRGLFEKYPTVSIAEITGVSAPVLHEIRAKLRERGDLIKVIKNRLAERALKEVKGKPGIEKLSEYLKGSNAVILSTMNPFELKLFLDRNKVSREAKAGDIAQSDIIIPSGNTNFPPGPILSVFGKLKIPVKIQEGSVWVVKDTLVAKKGDVISAELADLLRKLGIKPIEVGLRLKAAYCDGLVLSAEQLELDIEEYKRRISEGYKEALSLSISAALPIAEAMPLLLAKAHNEGLSLAINSALPVPEAVPLVVSVAEGKAKALLDALRNKGFKG